MTSPQLCVLLVLLPGLPCPTAAGDAQLGGEAARLAAVLARDAGDALLGSLLGRQDQAGIYSRVKAGAALLPLLTKSATQMALRWIFHHAGHDRCSSNYTSADTFSRGGYGDLHH